MVLEFLNNGVPMTHEDRTNKRWLIIATITVIAVSASLAITYAVLWLTGYDMLPMFFIIATVAPLLIAPVTTWSIISLLVNIQKLEEAYRNLATHDDLTRLLRRGTFLTQSQTFACLCARNKQTMSFATLDLDRFKDVNDQHGHGAGDEVLKAFADILRQSIRASDLAGRLGGEEFAIALPATSVQEALIVLERIRIKTEQTELPYLGKALRFTVSIGVSDAQGKQLEDIDYLIKSSDAQLYEAKRRGRNRIERDSPDDLFSGFDSTQESTPAQ